MTEREWTEPDVLAQALRAADERLLHTLDGIDAETAARPSLLPGWTVAHVLSHLAGNARGATRRIEGALRHEVVEQYPGGERYRADEIEAGAALPVGELLEQVRATAAEVETAVAAMPAGGWDRPARSLGRDDEHPLLEVLLSRVREVEMHHVDLGLGYAPADWPADFVAHELRRELPRLAGRADPAALFAWLTGRGPAPELGPWR